MRIGLPRESFWRKVWKMLRAKMEKMNERGAGAEEDEGQKKKKLSTKLTAGNHAIQPAS